jgi:hypothetical protein
LEAASSGSNVVDEGMGEGRPTLVDKGKPGVTRGRNATGLRSGQQ